MREKDRKREREKVRKRLDVSLMSQKRGEEEEEEEESNLWAHHYIDITNYGQRKMVQGSTDPPIYFQNGKDLPAVEAVKCKRWSVDQLHFIFL